MSPRPRDPVGGAGRLGPGGILAIAGIVTMGCLSDDIHRPAFTSGQPQTLVQVARSPDAIGGRPHHPAEFGVLYENVALYTVRRLGSANDLRTTSIQLALAVDTDHVAWVGAEPMSGDAMNHQYVYRVLASFDGTVIESRLLPTRYRNPVAIARGADGLYRYLTSGPTLLVETADGEFDPIDLADDGQPLALTPDASHAMYTRDVGPADPVLEIMSLATGDVVSLPYPGEFVHTISPSGDRYLTTRGDVIVIRGIDGSVSLEVPRGAIVRFAWTRAGLFGTTADELVEIDPRDGSTIVILDGVEEALLGAALDGTPPVVTREVRSVVGRLAVVDRQRAIVSDATLLDAGWRAEDVVAWSPRGSTMAIGVHERTDAGGAALVVWAPGGAAERLDLPDGLDPSWIAWSREGFVWLISDRKLWRIDPASGAARLQATLPVDGMRVTDGDGDSVCFLASYDDELFTVSEDGSLTYMGTVDGVLLGDVPFDHPFETGLGRGFLVSHPDFGLRLHSLSGGELTTTSWYLEDFGMLIGGFYPTKPLALGRLYSGFSQPWVSRVLGAWIEE